ncbi:MAG: hypothetical protein OXI87_19570 [Albidovulum sp.]|nr:hypothetical protein [Albidovulum sp.]
MLREGFKHGFSDDQWVAAKEDARQAMIAVARSKSVIAYSEFVPKVAIGPEPWYSIKQGTRDGGGHGLVRGQSGEE